MGHQFTDQGYQFMERGTPVHGPIIPCSLNKNYTSWGTCDFVHQFTVEGTGYLFSQQGIPALLHWVPALLLYV